MKNKNFLLGMIGSLALAVVLLDTAPAFAQSCSPNADTGVTVDSAKSTQTTDIKNGNWQAQTFTVTGTGCFLLNSLTINVARFNSPADLIIEIVGTTAPDVPGVPAGLGGSATVLASATISPSHPSLTTSGSYADILVSFVSPPTILGGVQYAVLAHAASGTTGTNFWQFGLQDGNPYAGGKFCKWDSTNNAWDCPNGSGGGLDVKLSICVSPCPTGCVLTQGFWKTHGGNFPPSNPHPNAWPVTSLTLGTVTYSQADLLLILNEPVGGNGLISLAHQLIAAKLNVEKGADDTNVAATIAAADTLIGGSFIPPIGSAFLPTSETSALTSILDDYNNGLLGPTHCP